MSQWHVLSGSNDGNSYTVAFHVPVPSVVNRAGINYQTALVNSGLGGKTVMTTGTGPGQITSAELAEIQSGAVYEYLYQYGTNPSNTQAQDAAALGTLYTQFATAGGPVLGPLEKQLTYFGATSAS